MELAKPLTDYLTDYLPNQRNVSNHTIVAYSHAFELLLGFASQQLNKNPSVLLIEDLSPDLILEFLSYLENDRSNSIRTRNARLAAIQSFFRYVEFKVPACLALAREVRFISSKKYTKRAIHYLDIAETKALLSAPNCSKPNGVRDVALLHVGYSAGLRISELLNLSHESLAPGLQTVSILGKGRRERVQALPPRARVALRQWIELRSATSSGPLFLNRDGDVLTRQGFSYRLGVHLEKAAQECTSLKKKHVTPHVLRHTAAMHMLAATKDLVKVSLWLGHASVKSTEAYLHHDASLFLDPPGSDAPPLIERGSFAQNADRVMAMLRNARQR